MAEAQKLHADVDPIYFSPNFKPMVKLVEILSAEARRAKHTTEDDSDDDTLRTGVRVHALEGAVATLGGGRAAVRDLRRAVARAVGVAAADQRLYASAAGRLELVKDDDATLLDAGRLAAGRAAARCTCGAPRTSGSSGSSRRRRAPSSSCSSSATAPSTRPSAACARPRRSTKHYVNSPPTRRRPSTPAGRSSASGDPWRSTASRTARKRSPPARASSSTGRPRSRPRRRARPGVFR